MNLIEDTQLMKQSKADIVAALIEVGVQVSADTPLSKIAELMKWAGGLRDVTLACVSKADGSQAFFTRTQWDSLSVTAKGSYIRIGVRVRAERTQFIVAKADAKSETGTNSMAWAVSYSDIPGLANFVANPAMFRDLDGEANTDKILAWAAESGIDHPAAKQARAYKAATVADGGYNDPTKWSLAAVGQLLIIYKYLLEINAELEYYFGTSARIAIDWYWSSTEYSSSLAWNVTMNNGNVNNNNKTNTNRVRPVAPVAESATLPVVYDIPFSSVIRAWIDCEREKRSSNSCTKFRWHAARDLVELWEQMRSGQYKPKASMVFMVTHPVLREVWAGAFRDRVAHHWEHLRYQPVLEQYFIYAGDRSMNCRKGYGALRAIETFNKAIYDFTEGYTRDDCYIIGGDFANFFMSIDKPLLWPLLEELMVMGYKRPDLQPLLYMMRTTLFHRCQENYFRRSPEEMWTGLPPRKSLLYKDGLPIGNLPSQNWANFLGAIATIYAIFHLKIEAFLIFVDDWRGLVRSLEEGRRVIEEFRRFLAENLHITLHPDKIYIQHYTKGTKMVGAVIKPPCNLPRPVNRVKTLCKWLSRGFSQSPIPVKKFKSFLLSGLNIQNTRKPKQSRIYIANRTRGHFIDTMRRFKARAEATDEAGRIKMLEELRASVNSYLGMMVHFNSYKIRRRIAEEWILPNWGKYIYFIEDFSVMKIRLEFDEKFLLRRRLKRRKFAAKFIRPKWSPK